VELFGGPALLKGSGAVSLSPYQLALLTLVYAHEEAGISRSRAIWLLWEESDDRALRQRMRQLLHAIRKRARYDPIRVEGDRLAPTGDGTRSDLRHYHELLATGELRQAASLHREGFAVNLPRIPTREFEDWLQAKRQQLRRLLRDAGARGWDEH
jgi:DNA-binding SARP family transcriptional activator